MQHGTKPEWYVRVQDENDDYIWIHVSESIDFCIEDVRYGYALDTDRIGADDTWWTVEEYVGPTPLEVCT